MIAPCMRSFSEATKKTPIDAVVKLRCKCANRITGHLVVLEPGGFQLCTCLRLLRCGWPCPHVFAALFKLSRVEEFGGECVHPRWRSSWGAWSVPGAELAAAAIDGRGGREAFRDGFTPDFDEIEVDDKEEEEEKYQNCDVVAAAVF